MGTSLFNTTPQATYPSLIKLTDNLPLTATLKALSDGLGNDSVLALSTISLQIGGATGATWDNTNKRLGIGTTTPAFTIDAVGGVQATGIIRGERVQVGTAATLNDATGVGNTLQFANYNPSVFVTASADSYIYKNSNVFGGLPAQTLIFQTRSDTTGGGFSFVAGGTPAPIVTMLGTGNVGIGTAAPGEKLDIVGNLVASGGIRSNSAGAGFRQYYNNGSALIEVSQRSDNKLQLYAYTGSAYTDILLGVDGAVTGGKVGIGTASPNTPLSIVGEHVGGQSTLKIQPITSYASGGLSSIGFNDSDGTRKGLVLLESSGFKIQTETAVPIRFEVNNSERGRWTTDGLCFNGDTAAANALDDYEEGTWTPNFTLDSGSVSAYTSSGSYTKIGKVVNLTMRITFTTTLLATINEITGYPFTSQNSSQLALGAVREAANSGNMWQWLAYSNDTKGILRRYDNNQILTNGDSFVGTLTYFV